MTAITLNPAITVSTTPFCDRSCKGARVFSAFLGRKLYALGLMIASVACRIFNKNLAEIYSSKANAQLNRGMSALNAYLLFSKELIDFSYNGCVLAPSSNTEQNALRDRYGSATIDHWLKIGTEEMPLKPENLKRVEKGICLGMSLDFAKHYLRQTQAGMLPREAIRAISLRYVAGASDEAQLAQIFYSALDSDQGIEKEQRNLDAALAEQKKETQRWLEEQRQRALGFSREEILEKLTQVQTQCNERGQAFRKEAFAKKIAAIARIEAQCDAILGKQLGLKIGPPRIYAHEKISEECATDFSCFLEDLPDGCYVGGFRAKKGAHAVSLIKSNGQYFLFDPNFGTLVFERNVIAAKLWDIGKSFYLKNGLCSFSFSSCWL